MKDKKIAFIGGGNMGEALIKGLLDSALFISDNILVSDVSRERLDILEKRYGVKTFSNNSDVVSRSDFVLLSVKPQVINKVLGDIKDVSANGKLFISIAAGVSISTLQDLLPSQTKIIRVMPNTPAMVKEGVSVLSAASGTDSQDIENAGKIFRSVGKTLVVEEKMMDAVTGLSGSGPAFVFLIIEALSDAGVKMGLPRNIALTLASQTVKGAAEMVMETGKHVGMLKDMVTSPGGTTIAGIHALEEGKLRSTLINAVEAATKRSIELGKSKGKQ